MIGVFGARGFLGHNVTQDLVAHGHPVVAVARTYDGDGPRFDDVDGVEQVELDFRDREAVRPLLSRLDTVVHLIGSSSPASGGTSVAAEFLEHVVPQAAFVDECVAAGVRRVVFASSGGTIYGPAAGANGPIDEQHPTEPINSHGISKLMIEKSLAFHGHVHGLQYVNLRISNAYGPGQTVRHGQGLVPALLQRYRAGTPVCVIGDGSATRDFVYVDDVVAAARKAVEVAGEPRLTVNIGTGVGTTVMQVIRLIESLAGITFELEHQAARGADVPANVLDVTRARRELDWSPGVDLATGLARTLRHHGLID